MSVLLQDVRYALREMRGNAAVTAVAVFSLALGIAPFAAVFSIIDAIGFRPLAIADPAGLVRLYTTDATGRRGDTSYPDYVDIRAATTRLSGAAAWGVRGAAATAADHPPEITMIGVVSEEFFPLLGIRPAAGRLFRADEAAEAAAAPVALISHDYWARRFGRSRDAVNSTIRLNTTAYVIVGVLPASFRGLDPLFTPDIWLPVGAEPAALRSQLARDRRGMSVIGRLREGATLEQAEAELGALAARLAQTYPATNSARRFAIEFEAAGRRRWLAPVAIALLVIPSVVLLIACANVAGLMTGRGERRRAEVAVRLALGARRQRLLCQFLTESALLALIAGALGLLIGYWIVRVIPGLIPAMPVHLGLEFRMDGRVALFALAVTGIAIPIFGLAPALLATRPEILPALKGESGRGRIRRFTLRNILTVGQIAGSLALLVLSGLLVRSFVNSSHVDVGFVKKPMILSTVAPGIAGYDREQSVRFLQQLLERLSALPSVESVTLARHMPLNSLFGGGAFQRVTIPGYEAPDGQPLRIAYNTVDANYFTTMGVRLVRGRPFTAADRWPGSGVVLVNQTMARRFWGEADPIGRWIELDERPPERRRCQIVGIVQDGKYVMLNEQPVPYLYLPFGQQFAGEVTVIARTRGSEAIAMEDFRRELRALDPSMPAMQIITLKEHMRLALIVQRISAAVVGTLGSLALLLSVVGLYGVIAYLASRRTREIGIRMALGARPVDVLLQVLRQGGGFAVTGIAIGLLAAAAAARLLGSMLYGVSSHDPLTYAASGILVLAVALVATYLPARRASRIDPIQALRCD